MQSIVMPSGTDSEISYRVKCVVVESERVFGDMIVTEQTGNRLCWVNSCHYADVSRIRLSNLTKQMSETPDFMALNRTPNRRKLKLEARTIFPVADKMKNNRNGKVNGKHEKKQKSYPLPMLKESVNDDVVSSLVDQLLLDIYGYPRSERGRSESDSTVSSYKPPPQHRYLRKARLLRKCKEELSVVLETLREHVSQAGGLLIRQLRRRDYLLAKRDKQYDVITAHLQAYSAKRSEDTRMRFSLTPQPGESGFTQWLDAMKMVARLQGGIPPEFRKRLWLTLAERHLEQRGVDWKQAEKLCFNEWSNPDDEELGIQIVKDLHRTGCSLFCGAAGRDNQAVLRRVLLGFARWNKSVGYCQGLNVLAAFVLQVTDRAESSAVKVMIYLIEGVLPEGYFADNLRGLSIDMAVFRDLLRMRLPKLSKHLEALQSDAKDKATGSSYEPPLTNVFTMQWFLTLFCHCLPQEAVLRVWDLIFLEGDEVLLRTALAIWEGISDRIMTVTSADEFYSIMGVLTREMLEFTDVNNLIKTIVHMGPLYGVTELREKHRYNITPWSRRLSDDDDTDTEEEEKLAVAAAMFGVSQRFKKDRSNASSSALQTINPANDRERLALDITTLKQQYAKLRERQRQAHIILSAACARQSMVPTSTSQAMNHLLVGKSALVSAKTRQLGPPQGAIPPKPRTPVIHSPRVQSRRDKQAVTLHWKDTKKSKEAKDEPSVASDGESATSAAILQEGMSSATLPSPKRNSATDSDSDSTSTELCDEPDRLSDVDSEEPTSTSDCYVMATDSDKSPHPGSSPIAGNTPLRQSSEKQTSLQAPENKVRDDYNSQERLDIENTSSSIAEITDQIRRLSSSDANNPSSVGLTDMTTDFKISTEVGVHDESTKGIPLDDLCSGDAIIGEKNSPKEEAQVCHETEEASRTTYPLTEQAFQMLDSYNFLSTSDTRCISDKPTDSEILSKDKYRDIAVEDVKNSMDSEDPLEIKYRRAFEEESTNVGLNNAASSAVSISDFGMDQSKTTIETTRPLESFLHNDDKEKIPRFESTSTRTDSREKNELESNHSVVNNCSKFRDEPETGVSSVNEQSAVAMGGRPLYSISYGIGHLPISPANLTEKLSKAPGHSPVKDEFQILSKDFDSFSRDVMKDTDTTFGAASKKLSKAPGQSPVKDEFRILSKDSRDGIEDTDTTFSAASKKLSKAPGQSPVKDEFRILSKDSRDDIKDTDTTFSAASKKLSKAPVQSPIKDEFQILSKDFESFGREIMKDTNTTFSAGSTIGPEKTNMTSSSVLPFTASSSNSSESIKYKTSEVIEPNLNSKSLAMCMESTIADSILSLKLKPLIEDALDFRVSKKEATAFEIDDKIVKKESSAGLSPLNGNANTLSENVRKHDYDLTGKFDTTPANSALQLYNPNVNLKNPRKNDTNLGLIVKATSPSPSRLSPDYTFHDSLSRKIYDDKKKSPKTPESGKSFSSGETMGPDSKTSSLTTSPRTPNQPDRRMFAIDKSERSSVSSDSKTLTLRSLDSDTGANGTKLNTKSDITRPSLDKSSPSTPISSDSLKNKSEISPKFVISSSSESCSPGKTKSSERSFSSELQSPISANSIKYRTNYVEGQDNLSESPSNVCSATSPFYPIVNPNEKTPSPYGATGKQSNNTDSTETSPDQKSTSSKDEVNSTEVKYKADSKTDGALNLGEVTKKLKDKDDYDSGKPFEKELSDTLSNLPSESLRKKSDRISSLYKEDLSIGNYRRKNTVEEYLEEGIQERYSETDTISPLPRDKYDNRSAFVDKVGTFKGLGPNGRDHKSFAGAKDSFKVFERSCSSLENRLSDLKPSSSSDELGTSNHKKRSSDILEDLRHLEAKTSNDRTADTSMLKRKIGYDWEDLKNLEARRQDNFSDSASGFSRGLSDVPSINVFGEPRKSYVVEPKMSLQEGSDSILNTYTRKKSNGESDDDRESKLGVWTKVKPRANRDNGRRSSDRALKIIQENSAILHKILTCQAKKRLPDLEEISKEITISPINEEISKIFSPILEKMGLNEHEISEELARINFQDFDQMTATSGSEFDAKINDELCKLSLIDDSEVVDHLDVDEVAARDYLDTREALIDRQINEELSKLLANYEEGAPACSSNREETSSCQNPSELEGLELSSISNNVFAYQSSTDSIETKSELDSIQDSTMPPEKYPQYSEDVLSFAETPKYSLRSLSPRSDIDIYRELEKLDKISSGEILPSASGTIPQKKNSPMSYASECTSYAEVRPSSLEYSIKPEKSFGPSPLKSPYDTYKPYDFKSRISPRKTPSNPYSARSYEKAGGMDSSFNFHDDLTTPSRLYNLGTSRPILTKETLEFRVRYDDDSAKQICSDDLSLEPYQTDFVNLDRGASYYSNEPSISLKRFSDDAERALNPSGVSNLDYTYNQTDLYTRKYDPLQNYSYPKTTSTEYDEPSYKLDKDDESGSYLSLRRKNSHSLSPNYQYPDRDFASTMNSYTTELPSSLNDPSERPVSHPEFVENLSVTKYTESSARDAISFRKASMSLGLHETITSRTSSSIDTKPSPGALFSPFPVRNASRKPKELGLKLGLYSPNSPGSTPLKRS